MIKLNLKQGVTPSKENNQYLKLVEKVANEIRKRQGDVIDEIISRSLISPHPCHYSIKEDGVVEIIDNTDIYKNTKGICS